MGGELAIVSDATTKYLEEIGEYPLLNAEEEHELGLRIVEDRDQLAREHLIQSNLRLVVYIAKKFKNRGMSLGDLIEEGNLGLIEAVDKFDPYRGTRFSTLAFWRIKASIYCALIVNVRTVRIPASMVKIINQWCRAAGQLEITLGRSPVVEEMADVMGLEYKKAEVISEIVKTHRSVRSIHGPGIADEDLLLEAILEDSSTGKPADAIVDYDEKQKVLGLLNELDPRKAKILRLYYGLDGGRALTLQQIGDKLNISCERTRQILNVALAKLYKIVSKSSFPAFVAYS